MFGLLSLPYEVLANVVNSISFDDVFCLGRTCKELNFLLKEERICKSIVQTKISYSYEAQAVITGDHGHARALRRCAKRRDALATVRPFTVATIGFCDTYLYCNGVLCYTLDDRIRILDLRRSSRDEIVVSIPGLLTRAIPDIGHNSTGVFQILYYSHGIISCLYKSSGPESTAWLIAFSIQTSRILAATELEVTDKIFARHNNEFLYYGTHSERGTDGYKKWVLHGYEFRTRKWFEEKVHLSEMVGSEIGSTICFEFHGGYFYALSNQTSFEVEEIDWTSFYHCVRFPLAYPTKEFLEKTPSDRSMWRRQHNEGPIDDRWTNLRLDKDESTGRLRIFESRKEWYMGTSKSQRTYYTTDFDFPNPEEDDTDVDDGSEDDTVGFDIPVNSLLSELDNSSESVASVFTSPGTSFSSSATLASSTTSYTSSSRSSLNHHHDISLLPEDPTVGLLEKTDNPHYIPPPKRSPHNTHPGNDGSTRPTHTLAKSRIRNYYTSSNTFMDLVDDPLPTDWRGEQRLRLRAGSRRLGPPLIHTAGPKQGLLREPSTHLPTAIKELYCESEITYWPPAQDPLHPDADLDTIYTLLNPPSHMGNVEGTADDRSMIYVTGKSSEPQALIFVGFDPGVKLVGMKQWGMKGVGEGPHVDGRATGTCFVDVEEADRTVVVDRKGKGKELLRALPVVCAAPSSSSGGGQAIVEVKETAISGDSGQAGRQSWRYAWKESAMYRDIQLGFWFGT